MPPEAFFSFFLLTLRLRINNDNYLVNYVRNPF